MKKIDTTQIVDPTSQQPFTGKSLAFIQQANLEVIGALTKAYLGTDYSATQVYVIERCRKVGNVINNGYIFYGGEIFTFIGADTTAYANVPVIKFQKPYDSAIDPVLFSDGVNKYVHELPQFYIDDGVSGSTSYGDYDDVIFSGKNPTTYYTPAGGNFGAMGVQWTGPLHTYNVEIYIEADVSVTYITDGRLGATFTIKNLLTAGFYPAFCAVLDNTNTSVGKTRTQRMCATWRKTAIAGGTNLEPWVSTGQADQHTFGNVFMRITEF